MVKKVAKGNLVVCDCIDKAIALAVMTSSAADKKETVGVTIHALLEDVKSCLNGIHVSFKELIHRLESLVKHGWGTMENNFFLPSKSGRYYLSKRAELA